MNFINSSGCGRFTFAYKYIIDTGIKTNGVSPVLENNFSRAEADYGTWKRVFVTLPPFYWEIPNGLNKTWRDWFWFQKENHRHFKDTVNPITGVVRIIKNGTYGGPFSKAANDTHYTTLQSPPTFSAQADEGIVMYITGHQIQYFQHFFDNGIPYIMLMLFASQLQPSDVTIRLIACKSDSILRTLKLFGFKNIVISKANFSATTLIMPEIVPIIHPLYHQSFRNRLNFNFSEYNKIIFVSRKLSDKCKNSRIINNQDELCEAMSKMFGNNFVVFKPKEFSFEETIELFGKASVIIGSHGGAMYNQMFSPSNTSVVEILPVMDNGLYVGQRSKDSLPPFAHLAIHTNCMMLGQKFFRYYQPTTLKKSNMVINVEDFLEWFTRNIPNITPLNRNITFHQK